MNRVSWVVSALFSGMIAFAFSFLIMDSIPDLRDWAVYSAVIIGIVIGAIFFQLLNWITDKQLLQDRVKDSLLNIKGGNLLDIADEFEDETEEDKEEIDLSEVANASRKLLFLTERKLDELRLKLIQAGFYSQQAIVYLLIFKLVLPIVGLLVGYFVVDIQILEDNEFANRLICSLGLAFALSKFVDARLDSMGIDRREKIMGDLPDALDLIVIYAETGTAFDNALPRVAKGITKSSVELATELQILQRELKLLQTRVMAYENLLERLPVPMVKALVSILRQSEQMGTPITDGLKQLAAELRLQRMYEAERKAAQIPVLITLPLIGCIFPVLVLIILGPAGINIYNQFLGGGIGG